MATLLTFILRIEVQHRIFPKEFLLPPYWMETFFKGVQNKFFKLCLKFSRTKNFLHILAEI